MTKNTHNYTKMHTVDIHQQEDDDKYPQVPAAIKRNIIYHK